MHGALVSFPEFYHPECINALNAIFIVILTLGLLSNSFYLSEKFVTFTWHPEYNLEKSPHYNKMSLKIILHVLVNNGHGVKINELHVPKVIPHGSPVVLDCDFSLEESDQDLVVKWYFNQTSLVYQWIPGTKKPPQGLGVLKDRLNLEYRASVDANSIHRALHILKAGPDLSGNTHARYPPCRARTRGLKACSSSYCIVPQCKSTTIKTPNKLFIYVPNNEQIRKKWLKLARRDDVHSLSTNSRMYFCADYFDNFFR
ncbi:hypothetical protein NQ317_007314, partial [Molorchus minor]